MLKYLTANDIKTRGVAAIRDAFSEDEDEVFVTVRGNVEYVVMRAQQYERYRDSDLEMAYRRVQDDIKAGRYHSDIDKHLNQLDQVLKDSDR